MRDAFLMRGGHGVGDGNRDRQQPIERQPVWRHRVSERSPFDQLHRQEELAVGLFHGMDRDDAGMVECGDGLRFALEPFAALRVIGGHGRQQLECHDPVQSRIARSVNLTHATRADGGNDFVRAEARAGSERQVAGLYGRDAIQDG